MNENTAPQGLPKGRSLRDFKMDLDPMKLTDLTAFTVVGHRQIVARRPGAAPAGFHIAV